MKKGKFLFLSVTTALIVLFTMFVCLSVLPQTVGKTQSLCVVLDAGHGGIDGGATGVNTGVKESEVNLAIVKKLQACLERTGIMVVLTRKTDAGLYGLAVKGFKRRDMQKRKEIIENAVPAAVVSIHQNSYSGAYRRGGQVFFCQDNEYGELLANNIQRELNDMPQTVKKSTPLAGDYYMVNCTKYPSVICECGFLTNPEDEKLLLDEDYQLTLSAAICRGIISYLSYATAKSSADRSINP